MGTRAALVTGTAITVAVTAAWSWTAALTIGPASPLSLTGNLPGDYAQAATAATGSPAALAALTAVIYALCLFASGWRRMRGRRDT